MGITGSRARQKTPHALEISFQRVGPGTDDPYPSVRIPDPYPISPPDMEELPDYWYVVDRGTKVGIFSDK